ncbi:MAG: OmpA family protein [Thalassolituus sp.]|uniref:InlB B-repeat-containing protein n=1 Tax=Thalassolituus sp. TaxID=2030822 RepID=UPI003981E21F
MTFSILTGLAYLFRTSIRASATLAMTLLVMALTMSAQAETVIDKSFTLNAFIGKNDTEVSVSNASNDVTNLDGVEFYRSSAAGCDLANYGVCADGQLDILNGNDITNPIIDTAAKLSQPGYYTFKEGTYQSDEVSISQRSTAAFSPRGYHQVVVFHDQVTGQDKLWLIGGYDGRTYKNDVWSSSDGITWTEETASAAFSARYGHRVVVFPDPVTGKKKLWLIGGFDSSYIYKNDIWSSADGVNWTEETASAAFSARQSHQVVVFPDPVTGEDKLWLIGGDNGNDENDVWSSADGVNWTEETASAAFSARYEHQVVVFPDPSSGIDKLWLIGGYSNASRGPGLFRNDVWSSADGVNWTEDTVSAAFSARDRHQVVVFSDPDSGKKKLWLIGGYDLDRSFKNDVWSSADGVNWTEETASAVFSRRGVHQVVVFPDPVTGQDKLWLIGGYEGSGNYRNDVWSSTDGKDWRLAFYASVTFTPTYFDVTAHISGGNGAVNTASQTIVAGGKARFEFTPDLHYQIESVTGCDGTLTGNRYTVAAVSKDCAVEATFSAIEFAVSATAGDNGSITPASQMIQEGSVASLTVTPDQHYQIASVTGCGGELVGNTYTTGEITAACTVNATFSAIEFAVSATVGDNGSITPASQTLQEGSVATLTVMPDQHYQIASVTGCGGELVGNTYTTGEITAACTVNATFEPILFTVATLITGNGSIEPGTITRQSGDRITLTVTADDGYQLAGISGCDGVLSGNTFEIANLAGNCVVSAQFTLIEQAAANTPAAPTFNLPAAEYEGWASVQISSTTSDAMIRCTLDGSIPTATNGIELANGGTVEMSESATLKAVAYISDGTTSDMTQATYDISSASVSGGGAMHPLWMLLIAGCALLLRRRKPSISFRTVLILPLTVAFLSYQSAYADGYIDGRAGFVTTLIDSDELNNRLSDQGLSGSATPKDTHRLGGRIDLGWQWHPHWSVEAGYVWLGDTDFDINGTGPIDKNDLKAIRIGSGSGPELALMGRYALSDNLWAYGRAGVWRWSADYSVASFFDETISGTDPLLGLGAQWQFQPHWTTTLGWDGYKVDDDINHMLSVGVQYHFGGTQQNKILGPQPMTSAVEPLVASESNHVAIESLPPTAAGQAIDIQQELQFLQSKLTFASEEADLTVDPEQFAEASQWLKAHPEATLKITGYTDNTGGEALNKELSYQRAEAVAAVLKDQGVAQQQLIIDGLAATFPVADNSTKEGRRLNRRVELTLK